MARPGFWERLWHRWRYEWVPADEINAETGTTDFYCTCWWCRKRNRRG